MFYFNSDEPSHLGGPSPCWGGWLYLAYDYKRLNETKIGVTTRPLFNRIRQSTTNPYYVLFAAFHIPNCGLEKLREVEEYLTWKSHIGLAEHPSGFESEWLLDSPDEVLRGVIGKIPNVIDINRDLDGDYDFTRSIYLPSVNPYATSLRREEIHAYLRFAAPSMSLEELSRGDRTWDERPNFLNEVILAGTRQPFPISLPKILLERVAYDLVRLYG